MNPYRVHCHVDTVMAPAWRAVNLCLRYIISDTYKKKEDLVLRKSGKITYFTS
jgi:hypothetical protein